MENRIELYEKKHNEQYSVDVHHHEFTQLLYVIEGNGTIRIDNCSYTLARHNVAFIVPYSRHAVASDSQLTLLVLSFDNTELSRFMRSNWMEQYFRESELLKLSSLVANELRLLLRKLLFEERQEDQFSEWAMTIHLHEIMLLLARAKSASFITNAGGLRAERIRSFIDSHYYETITSRDLAAKLDMSIRHLNSIFKDQYRLTPMQYLSEVRISVAKKLLIETNKDIVSICFEIGYESLPTFYRAFKNLVNQSPNQYRNQHHSEQ